MGRIVVGVDASPDARNALVWAIAEARLRQAALQAVHAYHPREQLAPSYFSSEHALPGTIVGVAGEPSEQEITAAMRSQADIEQAFRGRAEQLLDTVLGELHDLVNGIEVQRTVIEDRHPAKALLELSSDADLLVVGSRGHGGFAGLRMGSVSHAAALHAVCPVVVVPLHRPERGPGQQQ